MIILSSLSVLYDFFVCFFATGEKNGVHGNPGLTLPPFSQDCKKLTRKEQDKNNVVMEQLPTIIMDQALLLHSNTITSKLWQKYYTHFTQHNSFLI